MAKSSRQSTPAQDPLHKLATDVPPSVKEALRKLAATLPKTLTTDVLRKFKAEFGKIPKPVVAESRKLRELAELWTRQSEESQKQAQEAQEARKRLDEADSGRALARECALAREIGREIARELNKSNTESIGPAAVAEVVTTKEWAKTEVIKMRRNKEIPDDIGRNVLADLLERRNHTAVDKNKLLRRVGAGHLRNELSNWGLWPVTRVKIPKDPQG